MAKLFLIDGAESLERATILEMLNSRNRETKALNIANELRQCRPEDIRERMKKRLHDYEEVYLVGNVPIDAFPEQAKHMLSLTRGGVVGDMPLIAQVANRANHRMHFYDEMVSLFAKGYIPELREVPTLRPDEIANLAMRDRVLCGVTAEEERTAASIFGKRHWHREDSHQATSYLFSSAGHYAAGVERALTDHLFITETEKTPIVIFAVVDSQGTVFSFRVFCSAEMFDRLSLERFQKLGFITQTELTLPGLCRIEGGQLSVPPAGKVQIPVTRYYLQKICTEF